MKQVFIYCNLNHLRYYIMTSLRYMRQGHSHKEIPAATWKN